jgi:hypothetical protein
VRKNRTRIEPASAAAACYDARDTRGFDRKDSIAALCAVLAAGAIVTNALFLQRGPHPAPILVNKPPVRAAVPNTPVAVPPARPVTVPIDTRDVALPRPNPAKMEAAKSEPTKSDPAKAEPTRAEPTRLEPVKAAPVKSEPLPAAKQDAPPRPVRTIPMPEANAPRPPDPIGEIIAPPARRVSAVQRVLSDFGYGQIKPTGNLDRETQDAIEQFERAKKIPVTRQITPVLMRELGVLAGRPLE